MISAIVFDYDGTLMDTYPLMTRLMVRLCASRNLRVEEEWIYRLLKDSADTCFRTVSGLLGETPESLKAEFHVLETGTEEEVRPVEGMDRVIERIRGRIPWFVLTHRRTDTIRGLEALGDSPADMITGDMGYPRKPDPAGLLALMEKWHTDRGDRVLMVGDRPLDVECGLRAGTRTCLVDREGYFPRQACTFRVRSGLELLPILDMEIIAGEDPACEGDLHA